MNLKDPKSDTGSYVNGVYTSKNGHSGTGLNCPRGTRLYDTKGPICPFIFRPADSEPDEHYREITPDIAPDILPYYAISTKGRVLNMNSGKIMKENYRPNGYGYYCLAAENCKTGQKKYSTHRLVMKAFEPNPDSDELQVNHIDGDKTNNRLENLEWTTCAENNQHKIESGLYQGRKLDWYDAQEIRRLRSEGWTYEQIRDNNFPDVSTTVIQRICKNIEFHDKDYVPVEYSDIKDLNPANKRKITFADALKIRYLHSQGMNAAEIQRTYYPEFSHSTILDIVNGVSHNS